MYARDLVLINTLTATCEYFRSNRENLPLPIHMKISKNLETFYPSFIEFLESTLKFEYLKKKKRKKKLALQRSISEIIDSGRRDNLNAQKVLILKTLRRSTCYRVPKKLL